MLNKLKIKQFQEQEMSLSKYNFNIIKFILGILCFSAGLGIEFPEIYLVGNLGYVDCLIILILITRLKTTYHFSWASFLTVLIGIVALFSYSYHVIFSTYYPKTFDGFGYVFRWFYYSVLISVFASQTKTNDDINDYLKLILYGGLTLTVYAWINWSFTPKYYPVEPFKFLPVLSWIINLNANTLGFYLTIMIPIIIYLLISNSMNKIFLLLASFFLLSTILVTQSKAAVIISIFTFLFSFIRIKKILFLCIILLTIALFLYGEILIQRWNASISSNDSRLNLIKYALQMFNENPILGVGPKAFSEYFSFSQVRDAHNAYANLLAELGILAFTLFIALYVIVYLNLFIQKNNLNKNIFIFFISFFNVILGFGMVTGLSYSDKIPWIIIGLSIAFVKLKDNRAN
jgi:O-antigen ligase